MTARKEEFEKWAGRQRRIIDQQGKAIMKLPNKKEREAVELLEAALEQERADKGAMQARHKLTVERLRCQVKELQDRCAELREEVRWHEARQLDGQRGQPGAGSGSSVVATQTNGVTTTSQDCEVGRHGRLQAALFDDDPSDDEDAQQAGDIFTLASEDAPPVRERLIAGQRAAVVRTQHHGSSQAAASERPPQERRRQQQQQQQSAVKQRGGGGGGGGGADMVAGSPLKGGRRRQPAAPSARATGPLSPSDDGKPVGAVAGRRLVNSVTLSPGDGRPSSDIDVDPVPVRTSAAEVWQLRPDQQQAPPPRVSMDSTPSSSSVVRGGGTQPASAAALVSEVTRADGKREHTYSDGARVVRFANGTVKTSRPDGSCVIQYSNGDVKRTRAQGVVEYWYQQVETWQVEYPGGLQVFHFPTGQVEGHCQDGSKEICFPDGSIRRVSPDGFEQTIHRSQLSGEVQLPAPSLG